MAIATPGFRASDLRTALRPSSEEFLEFFQARKNQALRNLPSTPAQQRQFKQHHIRTSMFREGSELAKALAPIETGYLSADKRRAVDNCRMACLIHLNLIMADYQDFSASTDAYLQSLQRILNESDDDSTLTAEHLLWTLLSAFPPQDHYERIWKMSRLVGVAKRARAHTWIAIENALRLFLRLPESGEDLEGVVSGWDGENFLREVHRTVTEADGIAQRWHAQVGSDVPCSEGCQICLIAPVIV
jgi:hypothetical protein